MMGTKVKASILEVSTGIFKLGKGEELIFLLFNKDPGIVNSCNIAKSLSDGRYLLAMISNGHLQKSIGSFSTEIEALCNYENIRLNFSTEEVDEKTLALIKEEVLFRRCWLCEEITPYGILFFKKEPNGGFDKAVVDFPASVCRKHLNQTVELVSKNKDFADWLIWQGRTTYIHSTSGKIIGRRKVDEETGDLTKHLDPPKVFFQ